MVQVAFVAILATLRVQTTDAALQSSTAGPHIYLQPGQALHVEHVGTDRALQLLQSGSAEPLSLAQGDFHESGIPGLVVGYSSAGGNLVAVHQGNLDAFAPQSDQSWQAIGTGNFPSPFLTEAAVFEVPAPPDFLEAGRFTGKGHVDLVMAPRGGSQIYVLAGNGHGQFSHAAPIPIRGTVTTMIAGPLGPNTTFASVVVGVKGSTGFSLLVYKGSSAGLVRVASLPLEGSPKQIALGDVNGDGGIGAAVLADGQVFLLDWPRGTVKPTLRRSGLTSWGATSIALGRFLFDRSPQLQLALLRNDGSVQIAAHAGLDANPWTAEELKVMLAVRGKPNPFIHPPSGNELWQVVETFGGAAPFSDENHPPLLMRARVSSRGADDVVVVNGEKERMVVVSHPNLRHGATSYAPGEQSGMAYSAGYPVAGLSMRVNVDGRPGLVMLHKGQVLPSISLPLPDPTFKVNTPNDTVDINPGDGVCADSQGNCSLRAAIMEANALKGNDTIMMPAGTFQLILPPNTKGDASGGHLDITDGLTIVGTANSDGTPGTIIEAGTSTVPGIDKVFSIAPPTAAGPGASFQTAMSNVVCQFGLNNSTDLLHFAGGCFDADAGIAGTGSVALTNVVIQKNATNTAAFGADGGGIAFFTSANTSGGATITQSIIQGNTTADQGGGIFVGASVPLTISNSQVLNNFAVLTNQVPLPGQTAVGAEQGGGVALVSPGTTAPQSAIHASVLSGNKATAQGGGIWATAGVTVDQGTILTGNLATGGASSGGGLLSNATNETSSILNATFTGNQAGSSGGAIEVDNNNTGNALNIKFSRITGNTAPVGSGMNVGTTSTVPATVSFPDNWWGCNSGPGASGCDQVNGVSIAGVPFITLSFTPNPATINNGASTTLTASLLQDNQNNPIAASNIAPILAAPSPLPTPEPTPLPVPIGVSYSNVTNGTLSGSQTTIQSSGTGTGTATTTFTANAGGAGFASATVDNATVQAQIGIQDFSITLAPSSGQNVLLGNSAAYTLTVAPVDGYTGTVTITCSIAPGGPTINGCPSSVSLSNGPVIASVTVSSTTSIPAQLYTLTASGSATNLPGHSAQSGFNAQDFVLSIPTAPQSVQAGQSAAYTVSCSGVNGFSGAVQLSSSVPNATTSFNNNSLSCPGQSTLTVATTAGTLSGSYVVLGTLSGQGRPASFGLTVSGGCTSSIWEWTNTPPPNEGAWSAQPIAGGEFCSDFHGALDGSGATHVYAINGNNHLIELFQPSVGAAFQRFDISAATGTTINSIPKDLALPNSSQGIDVFAVSNGHLLVFSTSNNSHSYTVSDASVLSGGATNLTGTNFGIQFGSTIHDYISDTSGNLHDFVHTSNGQWQDVNLSSHFNSPGTAPFAFAYGGNSIQVAAIGPGNNFDLVIFIESVNPDGTISGFNFFGDLTSLAGYSTGVCNGTALPISILVGGQGNDVNIWVMDGNKNLVNYNKQPNPNWVVQTSVSPEPGNCGSATMLYFSPVGPPDGTVKLFMPNTNSQMVEYTGDPVTGTINGTAITVGPPVLSDGVALMNGVVLPSPSGTMELFALSTSAPDFSLATAQSSQSVACGCVNYPLSVSAENGFTGAVTFTASGLPTGATATFSPSTVNGFGETTLTICTTSSVPAGNYPITITAAAGNISHTTTVTLAVTDFTLSATPASQTVSAGANISYQVTTAPQNGFTSDVGLSVTGLPANASASFSPNPINGVGSSTMTVVTAQSTPVGNYTLTITGGSGCRSHSITVTLVVTAPAAADFNLSAQSSSNSTYTVSSTGTNGFNSSVALNITGLPSGASASISPSSIANGTGSSTASVTTSSSTAAGTYPLTINGTSGSLQHSTTVNLVVSAVPNFSLSAASPTSQTVLAGGNISYSVSSAAQNGFTGNVELSLSGLPARTSATFSPVSISGSGSSTISVATSSATPAGTYLLTITGTSGSLSRSTTVTLVVTSFAVSATPSSQTVTAGGNANYTVSTTAQNGFSGAVALSASGLPSGVSASFSPASLTGSGTSTLSVTTLSSTAPGTYTLTITGASGSLTRTTTITLVVNDFSLAASPNSQTVTAGGSTAYTLTLTAQNGFTGTVTLSASGLPSGVSASFSPTTITSSGTSTVTVTTTTGAAAGTDTLTFLATSGSLTASATTKLVVNAAGNFSLSASPTSQTVAQGSNKTFTVTVTPSNGFNASVALSASGLPSGVTASFNPSTVAGGSGTSTLTISASSSAALGTASFTITGSGGSITATTSPSLTVVAPPPTILRPTSSSSPLAGYTNPANAEDGNLSTFADGIANGGTNMQYWSGFGAAGGSPSQIKLNISSAADCLDPFGDGLDGAEISYSLDNGNTWHHVYAQGALGADACTNRPQQTDAVSLPVTQNTTKVQVFAELSSNHGSTHQVYEIWISVTY
jgi:CSLREA domain-containing protein